MPRTLLILTLAWLSSVTALADAPVVQPAAPKFLIGVWYQPASSFAKWKQRGINTLVGYEGEGGTVSRQQWMAAAHAAGLFYIVKPPADPDDMKAEANDPHLLAYEQPDEPDGGGNQPPDAIVANYTAWKQLAPTKPVLLNFDGWKTQWRPVADYVEYCKGGDWLAFDYYVINRGEGPDHIPVLGERLDKLREWSGGPNSGKKLFLFIECSDQNLKVQDWLHTPENQPHGEQQAAKMRCPTPDEMRAEIDVALKHGVSGIIYFPDRVGKNWEAFDAVPPELVTAMTQVNAKLTGAAVPTPPQATPHEVKPNAAATPPQPPDLDGQDIVINGVTYTLKRKQ